MKITVRFQGVEIIYEQETHLTDYPLIAMSDYQAIVLKSIQEMVAQTIRAAETTTIKK